MLAWVFIFFLVREKGLVLGQWCVVRIGGE